MTEQIVPDGMTTDTADGKPAKRVKLSVMQQFDNLMFKFAPTFMAFLMTGWTVQLWFKAWQRWRKKHPKEWFKPELPKLLAVVTIDHQHHIIKRMLKNDYHINVLFLNYEWLIIENVICLRGQYLVARNMFDKVDSIIHNSGIQSGLWYCDSTPGALRGVKFAQHLHWQPVNRSAGSYSAQKKHRFFVCKLSVL
jgi:hypothetical protein